MKTHCRGARLQKRIHDICHDVLSSHSLSFSRPPCEQSYYAWYLSPSLSQLAPYSFLIQLLHMSQSRGPILSHLASLPDSVDDIPPHADTLEHALTDTCSCLTCCDAHPSYYIPPNAVQLATGLKQM